MMDSGLFRRKSRQCESSNLSLTHSHHDLKLESTAEILLFHYLFGGEKTIRIINNSNFILYVTLHDDTRLRAVDPGHHSVIFIVNDTVRVTIWYYAKNREMRDLCSGCLFNNGRVLHVLPVKKS